MQVIQECHESKRTAKLRERSMCFSLCLQTVAFMRGTFVPGAILMISVIALEFGKNRLLTLPRACSVIADVTETLECVRFDYAECANKTSVSVAR